jgi:hypothetical protein
MNILFSSDAFSLDSRGVITYLKSLNMHGVSTGLEDLTFERKSAMKDKEINPVSILPFLIRMRAISANL